MFVTKSFSMRSANNQWDNSSWPRIEETVYSMFTGISFFSINNYHSICRCPIWKFTSNQLWSQLELLREDFLSKPNRIVREDGRRPHPCKSDHVIHHMKISSWHSCKKCSSWTAAPIPSANQRKVTKPKARTYAAMHNDDFVITKLFNQSNIFK